MNTLCKLSTILVIIALSFPTTMVAQWVRTNGPYGGAIVALASAPDGAGGINLFAGSGNDDGIFRSTDNGRNWTAVDSGLTTKFINCLTAFPNGAGGTDIIAGNVDGVFHSTDAGVSWTASDGDSAIVYCITVSPDGMGGADLFAGTSWGVFRSTDNSRSWTETDSTLKTDIRSFAVSQNGSGGRNLFAGTRCVGTWSAGVYRSTDDGRTWVAADSGLPPYTAVNRLAVAPNGTGGTNLFASAGMCYISTDDGTSWTAMSAGLGGAVASIAVISDGAGGTNLFVGTSSGLFLSTDDGISWIQKALWNSYINIDINTLISDGTNLFAGGDGVSVSTDNGTTWTSENSGLYCRGINGLISVPSGSGCTNLFALSGGVYLSTDNGASWSAQRDSGLIDMGHVVYIDVLTFATNGTGGTTLYGVGGGHGVFRSTDNGDRWNKISTDLKLPPVFALTVGPASDGFGTNLFAGTETGVFLSTNDGTDWWDVNSGLIMNGKIAPINSLLLASDGAGGTNLFAGTCGSIFRSTDDGTSWTQNNLGTSIQWVDALAATPDGAGGMILFAGTQADGVYRSTDNGTTWALPDSGVGSRSISSFAVFTSCTGSGAYIFAGATQAFAGINGGVFLSTNNGTSWNEIDSGMTGTDVLALASSRDGAGGVNLFASTHNVDALWRRTLSEMIDYTPCNLMAIPGNQQVQLNWNNQNNADFMSYRIYGDTAPHPVTRIDSTTGGVNDTSEVLHGLVNGTTYHFRITGVHSGGLESGFSNEVTSQSRRFILPVNNGWNLVAVPYTVLAYDKPVLFPHAVSDAFSYTGTYIVKDTLENGTGYWLRYSANQCDTLYGAFRPRDAISVRAGWNMIGSISTPIATAKITSNPGGIVTSSFFGYEGGYFHSDSIEPGNGYWVKVNKDGKLILTISTKAMSASNRIRIVPTEELPPSPPSEQSQSRIELPKVYALEQAYPNPFNPSTTIRFELPSDSRVTLKVYNLIGQVVASLVNQTEQAGYKQVNWNASSFASGIYFYRLDATSVANPNKMFTQVKKMVLIK